MDPLTNRRNQSYSRAERPVPQNEALRTSILNDVNARIEGLVSNTLQSQISPELQSMKQVSTDHAKRLQVIESNIKGQSQTCYGKYVKPVVGFVFGSSSKGPQGVIDIRSQHVDEIYGHLRGNGSDEELISKLDQYTYSALEKLKSEVLDIAAIQAEPDKAEKLTTAVTKQRRIIELTVKQKNNELSTYIASFIGAKDAGIQFSISAATAFVGFVGLMTKDESAQAWLGPKKWGTLAGGLILAAIVNSRLLTSIPMCKKISRLSEELQTLHEKYAYSAENLFSESTIATAKALVFDERRSFVMYNFSVLSLALGAVGYLANLEGKKAS